MTYKSIPEYTNEGAGRAVGEEDETNKIIINASDMFRYVIEGGDKRRFNSCVRVEECVEYRKLLIDTGQI